MQTVSQRQIAEVCGFREQLFIYLGCLDFNYKQKTNDCANLEKCNFRLWVLRLCNGLTEKRGIIWPDNRARCYYLQLLHNQNLTNLPIPADLLSSIDINVVNQGCLRLKTSCPHIS